MTWITNKRSRPGNRGSPMHFKHRREEERKRLRGRLQWLKEFLPQAIACGLSPKCTILDRHAASIVEMDLSIEAIEYYFSKEDIDVPLD